MASISIKGQTALVTGASSGIGAATAAALAAEGARLILAARRTERLEELAASFKEAHGTESLLITLDVRQEADVRQSWASCRLMWQAVDILVNNAGLSRRLESAA